MIFYCYIGANLGLDSVPLQTPLNPFSSCKDFVFVHTDSHKVFMDLLLEKRRKLETAVITRKSQQKELTQDSQISHNES